MPDTPATSAQPNILAAPWRFTGAEVVAALHTDASAGLSVAEARTRLEQYGPNELTAEQPDPAWRRFLAQFKDALVVLLLLATAVSATIWFYERDSTLPYEALAIFATYASDGGAKRRSPSAASSLLSLGLGRTATPSSAARNMSMSNTLSPNAASQRASPNSAFPAVNLPSA